MTMQQLAKLANVSVSTVSKAFHYADDISQETREHVFAVAKQYGCYSKFFKGKYPKPVIAIICPELRSSFYSLYVDKLQQLIEADNGIPLILSYHFSDETQEELLDYFSAYLQVDGILVFTLKHRLKKAFTTPLVSLVYAEDPHVDTVSVDIVPAVREAVASLRALGHTAIAVAGEPKTGKKTGLFCEALGIDPQSEAVFVSDRRFEHAGRDCAEQILRSPVPYTAVVCTYDNIALGVMKHLTENGYKIPQDFSVIGVNNIPFSKYAEPSLSTIDEHIDEMCVAAWELLKKKLKNRYYSPPTPIRLTGAFLQRDSVAQAAQRRKK